MYLKKVFNIIFVILNFVYINKLYALPQRVAQIDFDITKVFKLYTTPGRDTSIYFPCNVEYATGGTAADLKITMPKKFPNLITVFLLKNSALPTSLKVFCSDVVFVFDIVPSNTNHIDFLKIKTFHGELQKYSNLPVYKNGKVIFSTNGKE